VFAHPQQQLLRGHLGLRCHQSSSHRRCCLVRCSLFVLFLPTCALGTTVPRFFAFLQRVTTLASCRFQVQSTCRCGHLAPRGWHHPALCTTSPVASVAGVCRLLWYSCCRLKISSNSFIKLDGRHHRLGSCSLPGAAICKWQKSLCRRRQTCQ
jgi:hypothetical protein